MFPVREADFALYGSGTSSVELSLERVGPARTPSSRQVY